MNMHMKNAIMYLDSFMNGMLEKYPKLGYAVLIVAVFFAVIIVVQMVLIIVNTARYNKNLDNLLYYDEVTKDHNYNQFFKEATKIIKMGNKTDYSIVYMDIQKFKYINDTLGHDIGDRVLQGIKSYLTTKIHKGEMCSRVYADNFVLLLDHKTGEVTDRLDDIFETVRKGDSKSRIEYNIILRAGIYNITSEDDNLKSIIDRAIYAKSSLPELAASDYIYYDDNMKLDLQREKELERDMNLALINGEFEVYFQPKVDIYSKRIVGAEALVRWMHPTRGMVFPDEFIPFFEKSGFIIKLDMYMFDRLCRYQRELIDNGIDVVTISCNFSRKHLHRNDWPERLNEVLEKYKLDADLFEIEITETVSEEQFDMVASMVKRLKDSGYKIAIDDFGSGYSSIQLLYKIPIDVLKMDKSCISVDSVDTMETEIITSIINIAHSHGISIIWEGVENKSQERLIKDLGGRYVQGFLYARPMDYTHYRLLTQQGFDMAADLDTVEDIGNLKVLPDTKALLEKKLKDKMNDLSILYDNIPGIVIKNKCDIYFTLESMSSNIEGILGYTKAELDRLYNGRLRGIVLPEDAKDIIRLFKQNKGNDNLSFICRVKKKNGDIGWVKVRGHFIKENSEWHFYSVVVDVTEEKKLVNANRAEQAKYLALLYSIADTTFEYDIVTKQMIYTMKVGDNVQHVVRDDFFAILPYDSISHPDDVGITASMIEKVLQGKANSGEFKVKIKIDQEKYGSFMIVYNTIYEDKQPAKVEGRISRI